MSRKEKVSWFKLLTFRQTWAFFVGKFMTDPIWWFYMFWLPAFLSGENARKTEDLPRRKSGPSGTTFPASSAGPSRSR